MRPQIDINEFKNSIAASMGKGGSGQHAAVSGKPETAQSSNPKIKTIATENDGGKLEQKADDAVKQPGVLTLAELKQKAQEREMKEKRGVMSYEVGGMNGNGEGIGDGNAPSSEPHAPDGIMPSGPKGN